MQIIHLINLDTGLSYIRWPIPNLQKKGKIHIRKKKTILEILRFSKFTMTQLKRSFPQLYNTNFIPDH